METFSISILTSVAVPLVFYLFEKSRKKEEKHLKDTKNFKVQTAKSVRSFFLFFWLAIIAIMLLISATGISPTELFIIEGLIGAFSLLPAFGYLNARFNYYIISEKNIVHSRMFHKNKVIEYSDILYIQYYFKGDSLTVYNKHGIPLISIDRVFAGIERLTDILEEKGIRRESAELVTEEMVHSEEYMRGQKKARTAQIIIIAVCIISVAAVIIGGYLYDAMH